MKKRSILCSIIIPCITCAAFAAPYLENIQIIAVKKQARVTSFGSTKEMYGQQFDISIVNTSSKEVDLAKYCLVAVAKNGKEFRLETVDENLTNKKLKPTDEKSTVDKLIDPVVNKLMNNASANGLAIFGSEDDSIYDNSLVVRLTACVTSNSNMNNSVNNKKHRH